MAGERALVAAVDLVGIHEIAARAHVQVNTVHVWRRRHFDFPRPIADLAMGKAWNWPDVEAWIKRRRKALR